MRPGNDVKGIQVTLDPRFGYLQRTSVVENGLLGQEFIPGMERWALRACQSAYKPIINMTVPKTMLVRSSGEICVKGNDMVCVGVA